MTVEDYLTILVPGASHEEWEDLYMKYFKQEELDCKCFIEESIAKYSKCYFYPKPSRMPFIKASFEIAQKNLKNSERQEALHKNKEVQLNRKLFCAEHHIPDVDYYVNQDNKFWELLYNRYKNE